MNEKLIGLKVSEAEKICNIRVVQEDGEWYMCTADYDESRYNVIVSKGIIVAVEGNG